jgi:hypothetical protein
VQTSSGECKRMLDRQVETRGELDSSDLVGWPARLWRRKAVGEVMNTVRALEHQVERVTQMFVLFTRAAEAEINKAERRTSALCEHVVCSIMYPLSGCCA